MAVPRIIHKKFKKTPNESRRGISPLPPGYKELKIKSYLRRQAGLQFFGDCEGLRRASRRWEVAAKRATGIPIAVILGDRLGANRVGFALKINGSPIIFIETGRRRAEAVLRTFLHELLHLTMGDVPDLRVKKGKIVSIRSKERDKESLEKRIEKRDMTLVMRLLGIQREQARLPTSPLVRSKLSPMDYEEALEWDRFLRRDLIDSIPKGFAL